MYEQIRKRIVELVPELLELKFGCEVSRPFEMYRQGGYIVGQDNGSYYVMYDSISLVIQTLHNIQPEEILGTPPTLQDLLLAIERNDENPLGAFEDMRCEYGYDLSLPLKENIEQNPELAEFISNLLK